MLRIEELEQLSRYRAGELSPAEAQQVERALGRTPELARALASMAELDAASEALGQANHSASEAAIARALSSARARRPRWSRWVATAVGAAAAAAMAYGVVGLYGRPENPSMAWTGDTARPRASSASPSGLHVSGGELLLSPDAEVSEGRDGFELKRGVLLAMGRGVKITRGGDALQVDGDALVIAGLAGEPPDRLAHVTDALQPTPARPDVQEKIEAFKRSVKSGAASCVAGALLSYCVLGGSVAMASAHRGVSPPQGGREQVASAQGVIRVEESTPIDADARGDVAAFNGVLQPVLGELAGCFGVPAAGAEKASGRLAIDLELNSDGTVKRASAGDSTVQDPAISACLIGVLGGRAFPPLANGTTGKVSLPFAAAIDGLGPDRRLLVHLPRAAAPAAAPGTAVPQRRVGLDVGRSPTVGPEHAPITIVELTDFGCGFCAKAHQTILQLMAAYPQKICLIDLQDPLSTHPQSRLAGLAALAAGQQGKYWPYSELLFANGDNLDRPTLERLAAQAGLDTARFDSALDSGQLEPELDADLREAARWDITGVPSFSINGLLVTGALPFEIFKGIIEAQLSPPVNAPEQMSSAGAVGEAYPRPPAPERLDGVEVTSLADGTTTTLATLRKKVMVLSLWSSMAGDLRAQVQLQRVAALFKDDPEVDFLVVNVDAERPTAAEMSVLRVQVAKSRLSLPVYLESPQVIAWVNEHEVRPSGLPDNQFLLPDLVILKDLDGLEVATSLDYDPEKGLTSKQIEKVRAEIQEAKR